MNIIKKAIRQLFQLVQGKDGNLSLRRIMAVWFALILSTSFENMTDTTVYTFAGIILILLGLTTMQTIEFKNFPNHKSNNYNAPISNYRTPGPGV